MDERKAEQAALSESSYITIGLMAMIVGLTFWVGVAWAQLQEVRRKQITYENIDRRLGRIEGALKIRVPADEDE